MPASSSSSPLELTPPATSYHPSSAVDADDDEDPYIHTPESDTDSNSGFVVTGEDGYELRPLSRSAREQEEVYADEHGTLIAPEHDSSGDEGRAGGGAVVYDASDEEGSSSNIRRRRRRRPRMRKEFLYTREEEGKVVRKFDLHLVGFLAGLYMLSFLDRSNIGNAKVAGMNKDLGLTGAQYEWLLTAFYMTYISFEWMTLCYKVFAAHKYIACCVMGWGFVASMQGLATNWWYMLFFRALLGITEAAFGPGVPFYLSFFYRREELALRCGLFISAAPLATAYAGFLAYALTSIPSAIAPWRLLFILEGFPSMIAAVFAYYIIPDLPSDARFLTTDEKKIARRRLLVVTDEGDHSVAATMREEEDHQSGVRWSEVFAALRDGGNWIVALMYFFCNVSFSSLPVFLPTIINDMGYKSTTAQALSAPPYIFAFVLVLLSTWISDRYTTRSIPIILCCLLGAIGYALLAGTGSLQSSLNTALAGVESIEASGPGRWWESYVSEAQWAKSETVGVGVKYTGVFMAAGGIFSAIALVMVWVVNNGESESGRGAGIGLVQVIGQCGPLLGTKLYPPEDGPYYVRGMSTCCGALVMVCVLAYLQRWRLKRKNLRRERKNVLEGRPRETGFRFIL
ncbi:MFS general substrate transporter [Morchella conica CCBAS932]|uniref:MFS general substrate transporter n=1 Tax=Morchella conica CCBAS932 TaxID=1392247 RepID=A0A3N4KER8_9PEZI|nr:MFS general substrate transporter [Morchella conica CCBAS932]